ncbi:MAG: hypothetical protein AAF704_18610 [Cyanobacteria bacterium P01_D01_bin.123]
MKDSLTQPLPPNSYYFTYVYDELLSLCTKAVREFLWRDRYPRYGHTYLTQLLPFAFEIPHLHFRWRSPHAPANISIACPAYSEDVRDRVAL